jgi:hypothetical protein
MVNHASGQYQQYAGCLEVIQSRATLGRSVHFDVMTSRMALFLGGERKDLKEEKWDGKKGTKS